MKATRNGLPVYASAGSAGIPGVAAYTWSTKPSAAANNGAMIKVTDVGPSGSFWVSNGTDWTPLNGHVLLARSAVAASVTGTLSETALATVTIKAGVMGTNGQLRITTLWSHTNSANTKTERVRLGGIGGTAFLEVNATTTDSGQLMTMIRNRNSASSQVGANSGSSGLGLLAGAIATASLDTAAAQDIAITGQLVTAAESITLESYSVELLR